MTTPPFTFTITPRQRAALLSAEDDGQQDLPAEFLSSMRETYEREGFVLVRGLLDEGLLKRIRGAGAALAEKAYAGKTFASLNFGAIFDFQDDDGTDAANDADAIREAALDSAIPAIVAKVLLGIGGEGDGDETTTLRMLKDAFMAKGTEQNNCGWHVDDIGFWPVDGSSAGVNTWLALDDIPSEFGGGMAVSPRSHTAEWRQRAYETIGSTPVLPAEGVTSDFMLTKGFGQTCEMSSLDPALNEIIESTKLEFDYEAGDCLFCHRWLFHRSVTINSDGLDHYGDSSASLKRYTIRYEKGSARLIKGISLEPAILLDSGNSGKTLDEVCEKAGPYYPRWCPQLEESRDQKTKMKLLAENDLPGLQEKRADVFKEISAMMESAADPKKENY